MPRDSQERAWDEEEWADYGLAGPAPDDDELQRAYAAGLAEGVLAGQEEGYGRGWRACLAAHGLNPTRPTRRRPRP